MSSYRFLWATSLPLLLIAIVSGPACRAHRQLGRAIYGGPDLLILGRLGPPWFPLARPKPNRWLVIALASNLLLTGVVVPFARSGWWPPATAGT